MGVGFLALRGTSVYAKLTVFCKSVSCLAQTLEGEMRRIVYWGILGAVLATQAQPVNIALHKPYKFSARPNYRHCTDVGDAKQLTDGVYTEGYFWVQSGCVGWQKVRPVIITIDLGQREPIGGVSFSTAAGTAGVAWPQSLQVFVSDDQKSWSYLGDLCDLGVKSKHPPQKGYGKFRYATDQLRGCGRYVAVLAGSQPYCFVDEIEVWRGDPQWLREESVNSIKDLRGHYYKNCLRGGVSARLHADMGTIREAAAGCGDSALQARLTTALNDLGERVPQFVDGIAEDRPTILPYGKLHEEILALNVPLLHRAGIVKPLVWQSNRWAPLGMLEVAPAGAGCQRVALDLMPGEVRGEVFNITQPQTAALEVALKLVGVEAKLGVELCEVLFTDQVGHAPIAAALKPLLPTTDGTVRVRVPGGTTKQIWVSCRRPTAAPGNYSGKIVLSTATDLRQELELQVRLRKLQFPARPTLHVGGWDYVQGEANYYKAPDNIEANMALMREMYVDSPWATLAVFPKGVKFDATGKLESAAVLDFAIWDQWVARWHGARNYCVFFSVHDKFHGEAMGTPRFNTMVATWLGAWVKHFTAQGIAPRNFVILLVDEPYDLAQDEIIIKWAQAIKAAKLGVTLFEDPTYRDPTTGNPEMFAVSDILCPNTPMMLAQGKPFEDFYRKQREAGKTLWLYSCSGPAKQLDPVTYHRAQAWRAFYLGAEGTFFWAFGCAGGLGDSWRVHAQPGVEYSPYFVAPTSVMEGKHSQAVRESVQDYEYLCMLRVKIAKVRAAGGREQWLAAANEVLERELPTVLASVEAGNLSWNVEKDRALFDTLRVRVLELLED